MRTVEIVLPLRDELDALASEAALSYAARIVSPAPYIQRAGIVGGIPAVELVLPWRSFDDARRALKILDFCNGLYGPVPDPLSSGAHYEREPHGVEKWCVWVIAQALGYEDCEGLASWLAAHLRSAGQKAEGYIYPAGPGMLHCVARTVGGILLDPSKALGMEGAA